MRNVYGMPKTYDRRDRSIKQPLCAVALIKPAKQKFSKHAFSMGRIWMALENPVVRSFIQTNNRLGIVSMRYNVFGRLVANRQKATFFPDKNCPTYVDTQPMTVHPTETIVWSPFACWDYVILMKSTYTPKPNCSTYRIVIDSHFGLSCTHPDRIFHGNRTCSTICCFEYRLGTQL